MVWTALQRYSMMFIQFISGIVLARLLTPYDYGCIGMLSIFMVIAEAFIDGGFGSALIQRKNPSQVDYSTIFYWNIGMAFLMYGILFFCAPAIARFYRIPLLCDVLRVQGLVLFIYSFNIVQRNQLRKNLNFKVLSIVSITTALVALVVTIWMAYKGFGVWSLVAQNLITAAIPAGSTRGSMLQPAGCGCEAQLIRTEFFEHYSSPFLYPPLTTMGFPVCFLSSRSCAVRQLSSCRSALSCAVIRLL